MVGSYYYCEVVWEIRLGIIDLFFLWFQPWRNVEKNSNISWCNFLNFGIYYNIKFWLSNYWISIVRKLQKTLNVFNYFRYQLESFNTVFLVYQKNINFNILLFNIEICFIKSTKSCWNTILNYITYHQAIST